MNYEENIEQGLENKGRYRLPFNNDEFIKDMVVQLKKQYNLKIAIETGSFMYTTSRFFANLFEKFITFEKSSKLFNEFNHIIAGHTNAIGLCIDSVDGLKKYLPQITSETLIYLDAHWDDNFPLLEELKVIADTGEKPLIMIHDFKVPDTDRFFYTFNDVDLDLDYVEESLDKIYGKDKYSIMYPTQVGIENVGCVFIIPEKSGS